MTWTFECEAPFGTHLQVRRHRLHNGLRLVSLIDPSAPIIAYQSWYGVGSRDEYAGATGMAHLFEHLMFNQTKNLAVGEFDRRIEALGGDTNAATWTDWTFYRDNVPSAHLSLVVELEASRMNDIVLAKDVVEAERNVVMNERLQRVDDDVDGFASEELFKLAFTKHPYRWPTIGWMEDIKNLPISAMKDFYHRYYAPNNLTLVVVGDFEEQTLLDLVAKHYGPIPSSPFTEKERQYCQEPQQEAERRVEFTKDTTSARLLMGFRSPGQGHEDWPAVFFACNVLGAGASSPLYRKLVVERQLASSLGCDAMPFRDPSLAQISITATRNGNLNDIQEIIDDIVTGLQGATISERQLQKVKNIVETDFWGGLTTMDGKAEALGHYECSHGDFRNLFSMAEKLAVLTAEDVQRAFQTYFSRQARSIVCVQPEAFAP